MNGTAGIARLGDLKMLYNVTATGRVHIAKLVEAGSQQEANEIAKGMESLVIKEDLKTTSYAGISDDNFRCVRGAFYLVTRYSTKMVARCIRSFRKGASWEHHFENQDTGKRFVIRDKETVRSKRIIRMVCKDHVLGDQCEECPAKFLCYTNRKAATRNEN